ncbi:hypothetical protein PNOK_0771800 [Pyrrhoderma noxium]|uniref:Uncharacterized protein n=1 Tax=Pyrrhoderma noxium TaxID=2282107 RepID=A0A286U948_9AGAM|nr:hypothetical protein PNOK_0771800 [Pyrrhoderma noxium]
MEALCSIPVSMSFSPPNTLSIPRDISPTLNPNNSWKIDGDLVIPFELKHTEIPSAYTPITGSWSLTLF